MPTILCCWMFTKIASTNELLVLACLVSWSISIEVTISKEKKFKKCPLSKPKTSPQNHSQHRVLFLGLGNQVQPFFTSLGRRFKLPSDLTVVVSPGKGRSSTDGQKGKQAAVVQFLYRLLYSRKIKPDLGNFPMKIFEVSPLGAKVLQAMGSYSREWGPNFLDTMRKFMKEFSTCFLDIYVAPESQIQVLSRDGKSFLLKYSHYLVHPGKIKLNLF